MLFAIATSGALRRACSSGTLVTVFRISRRFLAWAPMIGAASLSCGTPEPQETGSTQAAIEGGRVDSQNKQVFRVLARVSGFAELCSATLIAPQLMLTARHCVAPTPNNNVDCRTDQFGPTVSPSELKFSNATEPDLTSRWFSANTVLVSPESRSTCGYDIAVVILDEPVPPNVAMPANPRFEPEIRRGETYLAVGYGASHADEDLAQYGIRHSRGDLSVACGQSSDCGARMVMSQEFIGEGGACNGDSGGPAFDSDGKVIGVLSRGAEGCASPVYVGVPAFESLLVDAALLATERLGAPLPVWAGGEPPSIPSTDATDSLPPDPYDADAGTHDHGPAQPQLASQNCAFTALPRASSVAGGWSLALLALTYFRLSPRRK